MPPPKPCSSLPRESHPCKGKVVYKTRRQATAQLNRSRVMSQSLTPVHFYKCPICQFWHIGREAHFDTVLRQSPADKRMDEDDAKTYYEE